MTLPKELIMIRHGQSEANVIQKGEQYSADPSSIPAGFESRHDSYMRLSALGVKQANAAGEWLRKNGLDTPAAQYTSTHIRTRETAATLSLGGQWTVDDLWRERDWGEYGAKYSRSEQEKNFPFAAAMKKQSSWYWKPVGGESLATGVRFRFDSVLANLRELHDVDLAIGVTHGEFISVARFVLEGMTPEQWIEMDSNPANTVQNAMIVHYSRIDPETGEEHEHFAFKRLVCPWDESLSVNEGKWSPISFKTFSDEDLMNSVNIYRNLL